jgi:hypothetical protein
MRAMSPMSDIRDIRPAARSGRPAAALDLLLIRP